IPFKKGCDCFLVRFPVSKTQSSVLESSLKNRIKNRVAANYAVFSVLGKLINCFLMISALLTLSAWAAAIKFRCICCVIFIEILQNFPDALSFGGRPRRISGLRIR
ncbi:MAG TPA: hypothetical protein V6D21_12070, partial [Candidatus Obscuribacterales bacterium]